MCLNAAGFQRSISLPSGAMLREGHPDGYILTCTQPVMSALCVWPGRLAECRHGSAEQRADRRVGREVLALASVP